jgi:hypothetical protein
VKIIFLAMGIRKVLDCGRLAAAFHWAIIHATAFE